MQTYTPRSWTVAFSARAAAASARDSAGQSGSANCTCATTPPPKNVLRRPRVRSMNWSGTTTCPGAISSRRLPTALTATTQSAPSFFIP